MKSIFYKKFLSSIIVVILVFASISFAANILKRKDSCYKNSIYYDNPKQYNVLFFGSSHMNGAVIPKVLSDNYEISSYNLAGNSVMVPTSYWLIKDAIERTTPELVVLDCYRVELDEKIHPWENNNIPHDAIDSVPFSKNKIEMIYDLSNDGKERLEYILPLSLYHNNWKSLKSEDFYREVVNNNVVVDSFGYELRPEARPWSTYQKENVDSTYAEYNSIGFKYLKRIIDLCNESNIELLLTYIPYSASKEEQKIAQSLELFSFENSVKYLNMLDSGIVNYESDFSDKDHVNYLGSLKISEYLGRYIKENYNISNKQLPICDNNKRTLEKNIIYNLRNANEVTTFITLLNFKDLNFELYFSDNSNIYKDKFITKLLTELIKYRGLDDCYEIFADCVNEKKEMIIRTTEYPFIVSNTEDFISEETEQKDMIAIIKNSDNQVIFKKKIDIGFDEKTVSFIEDY